MNMRHRALRYALLLGLILAPLFIFKLFGAPLTGGPWVVPFDFFDGGGAKFFPSAGSLSLTSVIAGGQVTFMTGGGYTITPPLGGGGPQADLSQAHAFPVPFEPSMGHTVITFTKLTAQATIRIYTLSGELVKTLNKNDGSSETFIWSPVANERGQSLASGVYIFVVTSPAGQKKIGKLMVIK